MIVNFAFTNSLVAQPLSTRVIQGSRCQPPNQPSRVAAVAEEADSRSLKGSDQCYPELKTFLFHLRRRVEVLPSTLVPPEHPVCPTILPSRPANLLFLFIDFASIGVN